MKRNFNPFAGLANRELPIPRQHLYAIIMLACFSVASITLLPNPNDLIKDKPISLTDTSLADDAELSKYATDTEFVNVPEQLLTDDDAGDANADLSVTADDSQGDDADSDDDAQAMTYTVKDDDNLALIFNSLNLSGITLQKLLKVDIQNSLVRLKPGQKLNFYLDDDNVVQKLEIPLELNKNVVFERADDNYKSSIVTLDDDGNVITTVDPKAKDTKSSKEDKKADNQSKVIAQDDDKKDKKAKADEQADAKKQAAEKVKADSKKEEDARPNIRPSRVLKGTISGSFAVSARTAGLSAGHIHQVTRMFRGRIDFKRDLKKGDNFKVLFDKNSVAGKADSKAKVLAVQFTVKGKQYTAFRNAEDNQFYDGDSNSMTVTQSGKFMRFPIPSSTKVSSPFNPHRLNPVTGRVMSHNGTDFSVHVGTPVEATGDAIVLKATRHPEMGNFIVLQHSGRYSSVYMHLSKIMVKPGQKINMGQVIGLSGNTGRSTGPHLHYEFHVNNRPVDPMRVDLPMNEPMKNNAKRTLVAKIAEYKNLLRAE